VPLAPRLNGAPPHGPPNSRSQKPEMGFLLFVASQPSIPARSLRNPETAANSSFLAISATFLRLGAKKAPPDCHFVW